MIRGAVEIKGRKVSESLSSLVVPNDLNENDNEGEEADQLEAMVGEVMKRNQTEKLEEITTSEVASDEEDEDDEEEEEEVEVSLPDAQNLDLDVENAQPVFRRQWSGVLPKMTEGLYWL